MTYAVLGLIAVVGVLTGLLIAKNAKLKSAKNELAEVKAKNKELTSDMEVSYETIKKIKQAMQKANFQKTDLPPASDIESVANRLNSVLNG